MRKDILPQWMECLFYIIFSLHLCYSEVNVKQQISSVVRSCLRNYKCSSYGEFRTLLERFNVSVEERTGTIDGRDYAGVIYGP